MFKLTESESDMLVVPFDFNGVVSQVTTYRRIVGIICGNGYLAKITSVQFPVVLAIATMWFFGTKPEAERLLWRQLFQKIFKVARVVNVVDPRVRRFQLLLLEGMPCRVELITGLLAS